MIETLSYFPLTTMNSAAAALRADEVLSATYANTARTNSHRPSGKAGEVAAELEYRLVTGCYGFGDALSINRLCDEFTTSRQPISAALNHLRTLGYVKIVPQVGCEVVAPNRAEIEDHFYLLGKTESAMAGLAASRGSSEEGETLIALAALVTDTPFGSESERQDWAVVIDAFHRQIRIMARSPALADRAEALWRLSIFYLRQGAPNLSTERISGGNLEREELANIIARGDVAESERVMEHHVRGKPTRIGIV